MIGFFRPCIVLPTTDLSSSDFDYTIRHELTHFDRGDMLLNSIRAGGNYKNSIDSVTLNESKKLLKERLDAIMKFKKISKSITAITALCTMLFCVGAIAVGAYAAPATNTSVTPWEVMGNSTGQPYTYFQSSYYQAPYIFEMGWNLNKKGDNSYPDKAKIMLSDKTTITVSFDHAYKDYAQNDNVLSSLKSLLKKLMVQNSSSSLPLEKPIIVSIKDVGNNDLVKLAEEYYTNHTITSFVAIFPALDADTQKAYCNKMFNDNESAFFAAILKSLDAVTINFYANKAYKENKLTFFTNIVSYLTEDVKQSWIAKSSQDKRNTFLAVLVNNTWITGTQNTVASLPDKRKGISLSLEVYNGGVEILPTSSNEITANYDNQFYDVQITDKNGTWLVSISGKVAKMGDTGNVKLYIPDVRRNMDVNVLNGDFSYKLYENCKDQINITASNGGVHISSDNHYDNSSISLIAKNKDLIIYEVPVYPDYFTTTNTGFKYKNGTELNKINVSLTGYVNVDFND